MKYIIIIIILFSFIIYYNQILSKKNVLLNKKEKEYKCLKKKLSKIKNSKDKKDKKVEFTLDNMEQDSMNDSLFTDNNENYGDEDGETFALSTEDL
jgi:hypothetical protein